jgi:mannose/fructose/N-acetylgalactosamine-specific phosphotransferase system component IIC
MTPERKLELLLGQARPPARDPRFEMAVMTRIARRRAWLAAAAALPGAVVTAALAWSLAQAAGEAAPELGSAGLEIGGVALAVVGALALARLLGAPRLRLKP